jgi:asparagine synthase (glutamine-hydrolysing)
MAGSLHWQGYAWQGDLLLTPDQVLAQLSGLTGPADLAGWLNRLNGCFALVYAGADWGGAAVDIGRTYPLFWQTENGRLQITDQLQPDPDSSWFQLQWPARCEFLPGHHTYTPAWQQLRAGEYLSWQAEKSQHGRYFDHHRPAPTPLSFPEAQAQLLQVIAGMTQRLIHWADGRPIVIPLSGGYDSRLILTALYQAGYPNLRAFTYGQPDSWEVRLAEELAGTLDLDWRFVSYTSEVQDQFFSPEWTAYADYAGRGVALPQEQDWLALGVLQEEGWLAPGSIICPGYTGDFQAGSYLPSPAFRWPGRRSAAALGEHLLYRFVRRPDAAAQAALRDALPEVFPATEEALLSHLEDWVLSEYVSKYILNGVRAYEWWGLQWYLPLWDREFITFWQGLPTVHRREMKLYRDTLEQHFFWPLEIYWPEYDAVPLGNRWTDWIPLSRKYHLKSWRRPQALHNINGLHQLTPKIQAQLGWADTDLSRSVNEMIGWWCLAQWQEPKR